MARVIPFGYANGGTVELERLMADPTAFLVDIRYSAYSRWVAFNKEALQARFPKRYVHIPALGNTSYSNGQPIHIASPKVGLARLINGLNQGYALILMCGCREYESCHRHTVVELLQRKMPDVEIVMPDVAQAANTLKCLSIQQPWCWLVANAIKDIENRDWTTSYRGPILLHAGAKIDKILFHTNGQLMQDHPMHDLVPVEIPPMAYYPVKSIVGMANLVDVVTASNSPWFRGTYGFMFENAHAFEKPIPYSGSLKLFDVPKEIIPDTLARVEEV